MLLRDSQCGHLLTSVAQLHPQGVNLVLPLHMESLRLSEMGVSYLAHINTRKKFQHQLGILTFFAGFAKNLRYEVNAKLIFVSSNFRRCPTVKMKPFRSQEQTITEYFACGE